jgi:hypothetical protein
LGIFDAKRQQIFAGIDCWKSRVGVVSLYYAGLEGNSTQAGVQSKMAARPIPELYFHFLFLFSFGLFLT